MAAWRGVENQSDSATLRLVDSREEHEALEEMLEASKPAIPAGGTQLHYLLFTPFRYLSPTGTRFRRHGDAGVWYGADSLHTACAELAYWRFRFINESEGLANEEGELVTAHTFFKAQVEGQAIDLSTRPWSARSAVWTHSHDYTRTQQLSAEARSRGLEWIRYSSVRNPGATCAAVLSMSALATAKPGDFHQWHCRATRRRVFFASRESGATWSWDFQRVD
jgi:hypothetical protein